MNKPVAFIDCFSGKPKLIDDYVVQTKYDIPLYTHPVKELTDEEIKEALWITGNEEPQWIEEKIKDAKAILRKAQEK